MYKKNASEHTQAEYRWIAQFGAGKRPQHAVVWRVLLAGMEPAQSIGLVSASVSMYCSLGYYGLYSLITIAKPRFGGVS